MHCAGSIYLGQTRKTSASIIATLLVISVVCCVGIAMAAREKYLTLLVVQSVMGHPDGGSSAFLPIGCNTKKTQQACTTRHTAQ